MPGIIKLTAGSNKIDTKKAMQRIIETKNWFFEKISKKGNIEEIDKHLTKVNKKQRKNIQIK